MTTIKFHRAETDIIGGGSGGGVKRDITRLSRRKYGGKFSKRIREFGRGVRAYSAPLLHSAR